MNGGSRIIAFGASEEETAEQPLVPLTASDPGTASQSVDTEAGDDLAGWSWPVRIAALLAVAAVSGWTGFFVWANQGLLQGGSPPAIWASLLSGWTMPVLLVAMAWLLVVRGSAREVARFGNAARLLHDESERLEIRLAASNRELSLARDFIAAQSRDLESLGRLASERLGQNADRLQELVAANGARVETIAEVSQVALENMEKLRGQLPVISSVAKDATNSLGNAGRIAQNQLDNMVHGFERINEFGTACESQILALRQVVDDTLAGFARQCEQLDKVAAQRFTELESQSVEFRGRLDAHEVEVLSGIRLRASALAEELEASRAQIESAEHACLISLRARLSAIRDESGAMARSLDDSRERTMTGWRQGMSAIEDERGALFTRIDQADEASHERRRQRLASISAEAELIERGIAERGEALLASLAQARQKAEAAEQEAVDRFTELLDVIDAQIGERAKAYHGHLVDLSAQVDRVGSGLRASDGQIAGIAETAAASSEKVMAGLAALSGRLADARMAIEQTEGSFDGLTDSSVRLLELLKASSDITGIDLVKSLKSAEAALTAAEARASGIAGEVDKAGKSGEWLANQIDGSGIALRGLLEQINQMQLQLRGHAIAHQEELAGLSRSLSQIERQGEALSEKSRGELKQAIELLQGSARDALRTISEEGVAHVATVANQIRETASDAIGKAMRTSAAEASGQLEQAAAHAAGVSREATIQLRDQLAKVNELASNLESRVARARERAEEEVNNDFARRAALITESLKSNAIDIAKAFSTDVSDTAWESYLRGDRGIFTRRAVSLVDNADARAIQQIFESNAEFRDHVSRYIHDFEAILRQVLSTRDGNVLGVTLLSSDMGKLYVTLAQAIERLRR